ncbi:hypothetical protein DINM_001643 [Dirofilaria immitis]|nr:hypothetical protein [Dirofilaria immitis]
MSLKCMPLLFLNMGSEMIYILQQRLKAQKVSKEKTIQQANYANFFEKLAHSSIMRLNETSMDKLYALITMTYKYQLQLCNGPEDIVFITLNHLDSIREILPEDKKLNQCLDVAHRMNSRLNVSLFLRENKQTEEGRFILFPESNYQLLYNGSPPGKIRYFDGDEEICTESFPVDDNAITYKPCLSRGNVELNGNNRGTTLGNNMYKSPESLQLKSGDTIMKPGAILPDGELRLLSALIISPERNQQKEEKTFVEERDKAVTTMMHIDARKDHKTITAAVAELKMETSSRVLKKGEDMLNLLDEVANRPGTSAKSSTKRRSISTIRK